MKTLSEDNSGLFYLCNPDSVLLIVQYFGSTRCHISGFHSTGRTFSPYDGGKKSKSCGKARQQEVQKEAKLWMSTGWLIPEGRQIILCSSPSKKETIPEAGGSG